MALEQRAGLKVVGEAVDGIDAVRKAQELQPDLILLDIGLPKLNGIAAALQISTLAPNAKLLFISMESADVAVREALHAGGHGYIHKLRTQFDLIPAVQAVLAGKRFVSSDLEHDDDTTVVGRHEVHFYSDDAAFVEIAARHVGNALKADGAAIVFGTSSHQDILLQRLRKDAFDIDDAIQDGTYISLDVAETFLQTMVNGMPDDIRSAAVMNSVLQRSKARTSEHARIAILSEWSAFLCAEGNFNAAIHMESGGNGMVQTMPIDLLCAYPLTTLHRYNDERVFNSICAAHSAVFSL
jgi:CheY-like chemotaxis protein